MHSMDSNGFKLIEVRLPIPELLGEQDDQGKEIRLTANDSVECSREKYASITSWTLAWAL